MMNWCGWAGHWADQQQETRLLLWLVNTFTLYSTPLHGRQHRDGDTIQHQADLFQNGICYNHSTYPYLKINQ